MIDPEQLLSLADAAELVGRAPVTLRQAAITGRLEATKVGGRWLTTRAAVTDWSSRIAASRGWSNAPEYRRRLAASRAGAPPI